jgi:hypothetical protein
VEEGLRVSDVMVDRGRRTEVMRACVLSAVLPLALFAAGCTRRAEPGPNDAAPSAPAAALPARATLECLTIEAPAGTTKGGGVAGGLAFHGAKRMRAGTITYEPAFTVSTLAAEGGDSTAIHDELMATFKNDYVAVMHGAKGLHGLQIADLQPPKSTPALVAGLPGHAWQVDSIGSFNDDHVPWRGFSMSAVFENRAYIVTAGAALSNVGEMKPLAERYFASIRFDGCK